MDDKIYSLILSDGSTIDNLRLNGNNFISEVELTSEDFLGKLSSVTIEDNEGGVETHSNMELVQIVRMNDEYWFVIRDISSEDLFKMKQRADLEYIAMMTGVDL